MKIILLFVFISLFAYGQAPNLFSTYLTNGIASTDTTLTFDATDTSFAGSGTSYYATIWDAFYTNASQAYKRNKAEIVLINSRTGNTFDVERGQLGTTARSFNTSGRRYKVEAGIYDTIRGFNISIPSDSSTLSSGALYYNSADGIIRRKY